MGLDILDLVFRLEKYFGIRISRADFFDMLERNEPPDSTIGDLFDRMLGCAHLGHDVAMSGPVASPPGGGPKEPKKTMRNHILKPRNDFNWLIGSFF
jgi:hypothetical protein